MVTIEELPKDVNKISTVEIFKEIKLKVYNNSYDRFSILFQKIENSKLKKLYKKDKNLPEQYHIAHGTNPYYLSKQRIFIVNDILDTLEEILLIIIYKIDMLIDINKDYVSYKQYQKKLVKDGYKIAKCIEKLVFTDFIKDDGNYTLKSSKQILKGIDLSLKMKTRYIQI